MAVTIDFPIAGANAGPGFSFHVTFVPFANSNSFVRARLFGPVGTVEVCDSRINGVAGSTAQGVLGLQVPGTSPLMLPMIPGDGHGVTGNLQVELHDPIAGVSTATVSVVFDFLSGLPYLTSIWPVATGAGHDPMLDTILADVQQVYTNAA